MSNPSALRHATLPLSEPENGTRTLLYRESHPCLVIPWSSFVTVDGPLRPQTRSPSKLLLPNFQLRIKSEWLRLPHLLSHRFQKKRGRNLSRGTTSLFDIVWIFPDTDHARVWYVHVPSSLQWSELNYPLRI